MSKDYYSILGVSKNANQDEIKKAFRKLAHEHHPDKQNGNEAKFKEINEAYQVLNNPEKRQQYDQFGTTFNGAGFQGGQGGFSGAGFNWQDFTRQAGSQGFHTNVNFEDFDLGDIFGDFFGGAHKKGQRGQRRERGNDLEYRMEIGLKEAAFGTEKIINIAKNDVCDKCQGRGYETDVRIISCPQCKGRGRIVSRQRTIFGVFQSETVCPTCQGEGKKPEKFCAECYGAGRTKKNKEFKIKIPAGIDNNESIKLSGQGEAGERGAAAGDLYITFTVRPEPGFRRKGYDLFSKEKINVAQAALGDKIEVETLEGLVKLKIPVGTESGTVFRLDGKGTCRLHGRGRGDQLVEVEVETPKNLSRSGKRLLEELAKEL